MWSGLATGTTSSLNAVWGSGPSDVWAVGQVDATSNFGTTVHYDGTSWSAVSSGAMGEVFWSVWGSSSTNVFAGTNAGNVYNWNGTAWSLAYSYAPGGIIHGIWGSSATDIWAVGSGMAILHYNGSSWTPEPAGTSPQNLAAVWGSGATDVWAVGNDFANQTAALMHWTGAAWSQVTGATTDLIELLSVGGTGPSDVWAGGFDNTTHTGTVMHWDGTSWTIHSAWTSAPSYVTMGHVVGVWAAGPGQVWAVTPAQGIQLWNGSSWAPDAMLSSNSPLLAAIWGSSASNVWIAGKGSGVGQEAASFLHRTCP